MKKILIFKTDRIGDLINISPVLNNLKKNFPDSEISLICSKYNSSLAKHYDFLAKIFIFKKPFIFFLLKNYKFFILKKYDLILQLDGKNHSYLSSILIRSNKRACIKFIKKKKIFGLEFINSRPNYLVSSFFDFKENCIEDYNINENKSFHYLSLYFKLLESLDVKIFTKNHFLPFKSDKISFDNLPTSYYLFHIDERWNNFSKDVYFSLEKKIEELAVSNKVLITSNINGNIFYEKLLKKFDLNNNVKLVKDSTIDELVYLVYKSHTVVSSHTGMIVHTAAAFNKKIIDIVSEDIFDELDRWIPFNINYSRFNINNFLNSKF